MSTIFVLPEDDLLGTGGESLVGPLYRYENIGFIFKFHYGIMPFWHAPDGIFWAFLWRERF